MIFHSIIIKWWCEERTVVGTCITEKWGEWEQRSNRVKEREENKKRKITKAKERSWGKRVKNRNKKGKVVK